MAMSARFIEIGGKPASSQQQGIYGTKEAEESLMESEQSFRGILNSVSESIYIVSAEGRFMDVNQGALKMYGIPGKNNWTID